MICLISLVSKVVIRLRVYNRLLWKPRILLPGFVKNKFKNPHVRFLNTAVLHLFFPAQKTKYVVTKEV